MAGEDYKGKIMNSKFEVYKDTKNEWRFRLIAGNGEIIAVSEGYKTKQGAHKGTQAVTNAVIEIIESEHREKGLM